MKKLLSVVALAAVTFGLSGCRMCCPSYDYCGPTEPGCDNSECCGFARRGSIFSGYTTSHEGEVIIEDGSTIQGQPQPPMVPQSPAPAPTPAVKPMSDSKTAVRSASARRTH